MPLVRERVHIAPVGFEVDRIVLPAVRMKADRVWLLAHAGPDAAVKRYEDEIKARLKDSGISCRTVASDRKDIFVILGVIRRIIREEHGNEIYLNASSGSKMQSIACATACMMFDGGNLTPYYAEPESYPSYGEGQQSLGLRDITELPKYHVRMPGQNLVEALRLIEEGGGQISKKEMCARAEAVGLITVNAREENLKQVRLTVLDRSIVGPLEEWRFVDVEKVGRVRWVRITQKGRDALKFLG